MFGAILKATNSSFQKCMIFCRSIYVKKVMKLLVFIFEKPSYVYMYVIIYTIKRVVPFIELFAHKHLYIHLKSEGNLNDFNLAI